MTKISRKREDNEQEGETAYVAQVKKKAKTGWFFHFVHVIHSSTTTYKPNIQTSGWDDARLDRILILKKQRRKGHANTYLAHLIGCLSS